MASLFFWLALLPKNWNKEARAKNTEYKIRMIPKIVSLLSITFTLGNAKIPKTKAAIPIIASKKTGTKNV